MSEKDIASFQANIQLQMAEIDLATDLSDDDLAAIAFAELSGTDVDDESKKLLVLCRRGVISEGQFEAICLYGIMSREAYRGMSTEPSDGRKGKLS